MSEWGSWGATPGGTGGEPPPPSQPWGAPPPPGGPYDPPPPYQPPPQYPPGPYQEPPPYQQGPYQQDPYQPDYYGQPSSGGWPSRPPASGGSGKGPLIAVLVVLGVVLLGGAGFLFLAGDDDDDGGEQTATTLAPGDTTATTAPQTTTTQFSGEIDVFSLEVGHCWTDETNADSLETVTIIPCDQPHEYEVYDAFDLTFAEYPGQDTVDSTAESDCTSRFESFVGIPYNQSQYYLSTLTPSEQSWANGDREVLCSIYDLNGPVTGSLAGAAT